MHRSHFRDMGSLSAWFGQRISAGGRKAARPYSQRRVPLRDPSDPTLLAWSSSRLARVAAAILRAAVMVAVAGAAVAFIGELDARLTGIHTGGLAEVGVLALLLAGLFALAVSELNKGATQGLVAASTVTLLAIFINLITFLMLAYGCLALNAAPLTAAGCSSDQFESVLAGVVAWAFFLTTLLGILASLVIGMWAVESRTQRNSR